MAFPRIILEGDKAAAAKLIGSARGVLFKARALLLAGSTIAGVRNNIGRGGAIADARIIGGQEVLRIYVPLSGAPIVPMTPIVNFPVYSGVVRTIRYNAGDDSNADIVTASIVGGGTERRLRSFRPTQEAWANALAKSSANPPGVFSDIRALTVEPSGSSGGNQTQYVTIQATKYSGLMSKAVQLLLGYGRVPVAELGDFGIEFGATVEENGLQIKYDYRWARCHIITTAADQSLWVVEISQANGIIAFPLPMLGIDLDGADQDVLDAAKDAFDGLPSGFMPTLTQLGVMLTLGTAIRLATAGDLDAFYTKDAFSSDMGWSTNSRGSEAHNTCSKTVSSVRTSYHYKLDIAIGARKKDLEVNEAIAEGSAVLSLVSSGLCPSLVRVFMFAEGAAFTGPDTQWAAANEPTFTATAPLLAVHINDQLRVVTFHQRQVAAGVSKSIFDGAVVAAGTGLYDTVHIESSSNEIIDNFGFFVPQPTGPAIYGEVATERSEYYNANEDRGGHATGYWPHGARDAYAIFRSGSAKEDTRGVAIRYIQSGTAHPSAKSFIDVGDEAGEWYSNPPSLTVVYGDGRVSTSTRGIYYGYARSSHTESNQYGHWVYTFSPAVIPPGPPGMGGSPITNRINDHDPKRQLGPGGGQRFVSWSVTGAKHYIEPDHLDAKPDYTSRLIGPLFSGEPSPAVRQYVFTGHT